MAISHASRNSVGRFDRAKRRYRNLRWRFGQRLKRRATLRESERWHYEHGDDEDNAATLMPAGERVDWPAFWLGELYAPSQAPQLIRSLEKLEGTDAGLFHREGLADWVRGVRGGTGAYLNVGSFAQPGRFIGADHSVGLPQEFSYVSMTLRQLAPGVSVLIAQFTIDDDRQSALSEVMAQSFSTKATPLGRPGGHRIHGPEHRKEDRLAEVRNHYRGIARQWIKDRIPGFFSLHPRPENPAWDLLLTQRDLLFQDEHSPGERWRDTLGFGNVIARWTSEDLPGLHLFERSFSDRSSPVPTFTGLEDDALKLLDGQHRGEDVHGLIGLLDDVLEHVLSLWTLEQALVAYEKRFTAIRDEMANPSGWRGPTKQLNRLRAEVMPLAFDLQALEAASENERALAMWARYKSLDFSATKVFRDKRQIRPASDRTLLAAIRSDVEERGKTVGALGNQVTESLRMQGELILAHTNVRLQWLVAILTVLVGAAGIYVTLSG